MKILQQILDKAGLSPTSRLRVPSSSEKGKFYIVEIFSDNRLKCNCICGSYNQLCSHAKIVKTYLNKMSEKKEPSKEQGVMKLRGEFGLRKQKSYTDYLEELSERENKSCKKRFGKLGKKVE